MKINVYALTLLILLVPLSGCTSDDDAMDNSKNNDNLNAYFEYTDVTIKVVHGEDKYEFKIQLNHTASPDHADNFVKHISGGNYTDSIFHRIIPNFMIQGGDFENLDGTGGYAADWYGICNGAKKSKDQCSDQKDWNVPDEANNGLKHIPCAISMAKTSQPNSGGSQFFIIPEGVVANWLDGVHTVFGVVIEGCKSITDLSKVSTSGSDRPIIPVTIVSTEASDMYFEYYESTAVDRCDILAFTIDLDQDGNPDLSPLDGEIFDFSYCDLSGLDLSASKFTMVNFTGANLSSVQFSGALLNAINFDNANMTDINFNSSIIEQSSFVNATLTNSSFHEATVYLTDFSKANFLSTNLSTTSLIYPAAIELLNCPLSLPDEWACLNQNLVGPTAKLYGANLSNLDLSGMNLSLTSSSNIIYCPDLLPSEWVCADNYLFGPEAIFSQVDLSDFNLSNYNLTDVIFDRVDLSFTNLSGTNLSNAYIGASIIHQTNFSSANLNEMEARWLFGCPVELPIDWVCRAGIDWDSTGSDIGEELTIWALNTTYGIEANWLLGPNASLNYVNIPYLIKLDLSNLNLSNASFGNSNLLGANLSTTNLNDTVWINTICPNGTNSESNNDTCINQTEL